MSNNKPTALPAYTPGPPPMAAPPTYAQAVGGVPPSSPFTAAQPQNGPTILTTVVPVGPQSTHMICPHCLAEIETSTKTEPGMIAYISGVVIALLGCWLGCCLIPCCIPECMDVHHNCPNCKAYLGRFRRWFNLQPLFNHIWLYNSFTILFLILNQLLQQHKFCSVVLLFTSTISMDLTIFLSHLAFRLAYCFQSI